MLIHAKTIIKHNLNTYGGGLYGVTEREFLVELPLSNVNRAHSIDQEKTEVYMHYRLDVQIGTNWQAL
jgi:hypothetical protein